MQDSKETDRRTFLKYAGAAATGVTLSTAGCVGGDDGGGQTLESVTVTQGAFPDNLDPVKDNSTPTYNVLDQAYEPFLYRDKESGEPIARVMDQFERIDDSTVELGLRDGVTFHNGDDCTTEDIAFSINRANDPDVSEVAAVIGDIDEAVAVDDTTVELNLNAAVPVIFRNLGAFGRVTQQSFIESNDIDATTNIRGTGPYQLSATRREPSSSTRSTRTTGATSPTFRLCDSTVAPNPALASMRWRPVSRTL
jgi:ABC-type dipeptide transport system, periplasmic component